jgi:hypothetical protein
LNGAAGGDGGSNGRVLLLNDYFFAVVVVLSTSKGLVVRVLVAVRVDGVLDAVCYLVGGFGDSLT